MDSLFVIQGNDQGRRYVLNEAVITVGRDSTNKIRLRDPEASRRHAEICLRESGRILTDLESSNGVFVNGRKTTSRRLVNGDQIQIGKTILLFASRTVDVGAKEPLVDVFQEEVDSISHSRVLHSLEPEESRRLFERSTEDGVKSAWLEKARAHLNFMYHATLAASRTLDVEQLLNRILELVFQWAPVDRGCIFLYDVDTDKLIPKASRTRKKDGRVNVSQTILNYALHSQKGVLTSNAQFDQRWDGSASVLQTGVKEAICVPMQGRYGLVGVVYIDVSRRSGDESYDLPIGESVAVTADDSNIQVLSSDKNQSERPLGTEALDAPNSSLLNRKASENSLDSFQKNTSKSSLSGLDENLDVRNETSAPLPQDEENASEIYRIFSPQATKSKKLTLDHLKLMVAIARQAALAVEDTQYYLGMAQAERLAAIGQTVAVLSHHIKNILQGIRGGSFLIHTGLNEHDEGLVSKGWKIVEKNQTKISDLVLDMLTFSKERTPVWSFANFNDVMEDVIELMKGRASDLEVDLEYFPKPELPSFYFDKEQIHRAVVNLIGNALEASKDYDPESSRYARVPPEKRYPRARVETSLEFDPVNKKVCVIVDDVGQGVPVEMRDVLFKPFASKNKSGGTGLGLSVTHKIVQEHKGKVTVEDSPLGGARFIVELPLVLEKPVEDESN